MRKRGRVGAVSCCDRADVLDVLTDQHDQIEALIGRLQAGEGDRTDLFHELADLLAAHAASEEHAFYPAVMRPETSELLHDSVADHLVLKRILSDMFVFDPDDDVEEFDQQVELLREHVARHARNEEEEQLFPVVREILTAAERAELAGQYLAMFSALMEREPGRNISADSDQVAPLPPEPQLSDATR